MAGLDDPQVYRTLDPENYYRLIYDFPLQLKEALALSFSAAPEQPFDSIVLCGMGGSAIAGDLVLSLLRYELSLPFVVVRQYHLPKSVTALALVIASSYSGNTEETLAAYDQARARGCPIVALTTGGELLLRAERDGCGYCVLPPGYPPRAALAFSFVPLLGLLTQLRLTHDWREEVQKASEFLRHVREEWNQKSPVAKNLAKQIAEKLYRRIPIIYASGDRLDAVATRWKGQICENAKTLAFANFFPEFNHNELVGWQVLEGVREKLIALFLEDAGDHPRIRRRSEIVQRVIEGKNVAALTIPSQGTSFLSRLLYLVYLGDLASYYLALLSGVNPKPVAVIDFLKAELVRS